MSDRNFNNFNDDFDDDFEDDDFENDDLLDASGRGAREIGGDRDSAVLRPFIQEIEQIPPEHLANLLQMVRLFRQSVGLAERTARAEAQNSVPIQPTVLPPVAPIDTAPTDTPASAPDTTPLDLTEKSTEIDPIEKLLMRSRFEPSSDRTTEQVTKIPTESSQEPPRIPLRLPQTSETNVEPAALEVAVGEYGEYGVKPASVEDESDWDELMDFLDQDNPKDFREEEGDDSRNDDWDEYFRPSP